MFPHVHLRRLGISGALVAGLLVSGTALGAEQAAAVSKSTIQVVAHRGDTRDAPEATLAAFQDAINDGTDAIEFDVKFTKDGVPVAMHDDTVDRTTSGSRCSGLVSSLTWSVLHMCDAGSWFGHAFKDQRVPSVDQAVTYIAAHSKTTKIYIHINFSGITSSQAKRLVKVVADDGLNTSRTTFVGEDESSMKLLKKYKAHRLGRMVHTTADWNLKKYPVLVAFSPYTSVVNSHYIKKAVKRGQLVLPVEGHPLSRSQIIASGANGIYLNNLEAGLKLLGRKVPSSRPTTSAPKPTPPTTPPPASTPAATPTTSAPVTPAATTSGGPTPPSGGSTPTSSDGGTAAGTTDATAATAGGPTAGD